jgi:serine/threonine protein kinase
MLLGSFVTGNNDNYRIISKMTEGGMAITYLAVNSRNENVVIKTPAIKLDGYDHIRKEKLEVEAKILRDLSIPGNNHVVRYVDESRTNTDFHLIIEKLSDETLKNRVEKRGIDERTATQYLQYLLDGLRYIHAKNIIHRDIKPGNILFNVRGEPTFIDFGAAKDGFIALGPETQIGTPPWSCPHQFQSGLTSSCDIYAMGVVIFYMITGLEPLQYMKSNGTLTKKPHELRGNINKNLSELVYMMIDPSHKIISTVSDVESYLQKGSISHNIHPYVIINGIRYEIHDEIDIGRQHGICDDSCKQIGFKTPPRISIPQGTEKFISKHHARIWKDKNGYCWIQDLRSKNGTAIYKSGTYRLLGSGQKEMLVDQSIVALCYNPNRGPYLPFTFHER